MRCGEALARLTQIQPLEQQCVPFGKVVCTPFQRVAVVSLVAVPHPGASRAIGLWLGRDGVQGFKIAITEGFPGVLPPRVAGRPHG